jgi:signal transduction histidine kinase
LLIVVGSQWSVVEESRILGRGLVAGNMKQKPIGFSQRYGTALRKLLKQGSHANLHPALTLGRQAVALGLETLELARIHEQALITLDASGLPGSRNGMLKRAEIFFAAANTVIEETHRAARQGKIDRHRLNEKLKQRTAELVAAHRQLKSSQSLEGSLKSRVDHYPRLLKESLQLQKGLRRLTHKNLTEQERERNTISHHLQDEIAQTLLSINVRLLNLKTAARGNKADLAKEIASTQRLVEATVKSINRFARELGIRRPA